jgi:hypothetical protein
MALCALVPATLLASPLVHLHSDDHAAPVMHSHAEGHHSHASESGQSAFETADHQPLTFINALCGVCATSGSFAVLVTSASPVPPPETRRAETVVERTPGHDPPCVASLASRAPPV